ncbi:MAG TPA: GatB/YqeY domain-containing protein [bacterium]|nr:GatB/YqeY domain-containing protein [bacterium]HPN45264.1 GatB/YqeY domain-containing protein [bacterium]
MSILDRLTEDMKQAMKSGEKERLGTIRLLRGQIKDTSIYQQKELSEEEEIAVLTNAAKKRRESIDAFKTAGRNDLVEKESYELEIIQSYLPEQIGPEELEKIVDAAIRESGAQTIKDLGKVMPVLMAKVKGRADGKLTSQLVKNKLGM